RGSWGSTRRFTCLVAELGPARLTLPIRERAGCAARPCPTLLDGVEEERAVPMTSVQVRYIVRDVDASIPFYVEHLGFELQMHPAPPFAMLTRGELRLVLSAPNPSAGGGQPMPDGTPQQPGGWNRFAIEVGDLASTVERLRKAGVHFRNT